MRILLLVILMVFLAPMSQAGPAAIANPGAVKIAATRLGRIYVKNFTDHSFKISVYRSDGVKVGKFWSFDPHEGEDKNKGSYLTHREAAGLHPPTVLMAQNQSGRLYVKNLTDRSFSMTVGRDGAYEVGATPWKFAPHEGQDRERGVYLTQGEDPLVFNTNDTISLWFDDDNRGVRGYSAGHSRNKSLLWNDEGYWTFYVDSTTFDE